VNLAVIESHLRPAVQSAVGDLATVRLGPPVLSTVTGMRFEVWVHAQRFEDLSSIPTTGAVSARRPLELVGDVHGFAEERPGRIHVEITCTGPAYDTLATICAAIPPAVLPVLETMPHPLLASLPDESVTLRFGDCTAAVHSAITLRRTVEDASYFSALLDFRLDGFLHIVVAKQGGLARSPRESRPEGVLAIRVFRNPSRGPATDEHVVVTNTGRAPVQLEGYVLQNAATRPARFTFPALILSPGKDVRVWTRRGDDDAGNLFWGRAQSVWKINADTAALLDTTGEPVAHHSYPE